MEKPFLLATTAITGAYMYTNVRTLYSQDVVNYVPPVEVFEFEPKINVLVRVDQKIKMTSDN